MSGFTPFTMIRAMILFVVLASGQRVVAQGDRPVIDEATTEQVATLAGSANPATTDATGQALAGLGEKAIPSMLTILWGPPGGGHPAEGTFPVGPMPLTHENRLNRDQAIEVALGSFSPSQVQTGALFVLSARDDLRARVLALRTLGKHGDAETLKVLGQVLNGVAPELMAAPPFTTEFTRTVSSLFEEKGAKSALASAFSTYPAPMRRCTVEAISYKKHLTAAEALLKLLGNSSDTDITILNRLTAMPPVILSHVPPRHWDQLNQSFGHSDWVIRATAYALAGKLDARAWTPHLLKGLKDRHPRARQQALLALKALTGQRFEYTPRRWEAWFEAETVWENERLRPLLDVLEHESDPAALAQALAEVGRHRLVASDVERQAIGFLQNESALVRATACKTLQNLGLARGAEGIVALMKDQHPAVVVAAGDALRAFLPHGTVLRDDILHTLLN